MKRSISLVILLMVLISSFILAQPKVYYVANGGDDTNNGSIYFPFATLTKAASTAAAGDTIFVRGGTYNLSSTVTLSKSGTSSSYYNLFAYKSEKPVFNFSTQTSSDGIKVNGSYWHLKGIESTYAAHNGIAINGSNNIIQNCTTHNNRNTGMQLGNGASNNRIMNCDSYYNSDPPSGENADGFSPKLDVGTGNYFYGCRSWQNADDGFDGYLRTSDKVTTTYENCWSFGNGYFTDGTSATEGDGNGFKMGGSDNKDLRHNAILKNCVSFDNKVKGFDQNNNRGSMTLYNCTGFRNGTYNFSIPGPIDAGYTATIKNSISLLSQGVNILTAAVQAANTWISPFTVSETDFVSIDTAGVRGPRKADGSLPDVNFMHLKSTSALIDAGVDVGIAFAGNAPDLGAFEYGIAQTPPVAVEKTDAIPSSFILKQNYPNPFNPTTAIKYEVAKNSHIKIAVYDMLGREIQTLVNEIQSAGSYIVQFSGARLSSGVYICRVQSGAFTQSKKMMLLK